MRRRTVPKSQVSVTGGENQDNSRTGTGLQLSTRCASLCLWEERLQIPALSHGGPQHPICVPWANPVSCTSANSSTTSAAAPLSHNRSSRLRP